MCLSRWFFEGVLVSSYAQIIILIICIILITHKRRSDVKDNCHLFLYPIAIIISLLASGTTGSITLKFAIVCLITIYCIMYDCKIEAFQIGLNIILILAIFYSLSIIIQFLSGYRFNLFLRNILSDSAYDLAMNYTNLGHYYGIFYAPSDPAGIIGFSIVSLLFNGLFNKGEIKRKVLILLLLIPLLLTGKKGIIGIVVLSATVVIVIQKFERKQYGKVFSMIALVIILFYLFRILALSHPEFIILQRYNDFFESIAGGESFDSGRSVLIGHAMQFWRNGNQYFGIGWRHFLSYTTNVLHAKRAHEVNCDYVQFLCEMGIVGLSLMTIMISINLYRAIKVCVYLSSKKEKNSESYIGLFCVFIQIFITAYAAVEIPFYDITFLSIYLITASIIGKTHEKIVHAGNINRHYNKVLKGGF